MPQTAATAEEGARAGSTARPTWVHWRIMGCITLVVMLTYLDRLNIGIAGKYIQDEFSLSAQTLGWVFSAFLLGYALFQIPGGWLGDRWGGRNTLTLSILWWSVFTALTAFAPRLPLAAWVGVTGSLVTVRFLVGVGEAASSPGANKVVSGWMGSGHRAIGSSFTILGIGLGGAITPPAIAWMMQRWGWRSSFVACGALGILIAIFWHWYVRNRPEEHRGVNPAELERIRASAPAHSALGEGKRANPPWGKMLSSVSVWALVLGYFCQGYPIYIYHTWFFIYLVKVRHLTITQGGFWDATPYIAIAILAPLGGWFSDRASRKWGKKRGRQSAVWLGMFSSAALIWIGSGIGSRALAIPLLALGGGLNMFAATTFWAACIDLTQEFTASLSGLMNTFGNLGGWLSPILTAYLATRFGWRTALDFAAVVTVASGLFWFLVDASQSLDARDVRAAVPAAGSPGTRSTRSSE
ncbi:MAG TPA: MFS transporter [Candidatus Acidoferrales bacterium]|nr:MFS transporter [Candidatus Acidoferrales bacterium]